MSRKNIIFVIFCILLILTYSGALAQPPDAGDPSGPAVIPIDGGIFSLFASGIFYAIKKLYMKQKEK